MRMRPLTLSERAAGATSIAFRHLLDGQVGDVRAGPSGVTLAGYVDEILRSGWPAMRHLDGAALERQLDGYLELIVQRDVEETGHRVRRPASLRNWLRAYAAASATSASWEQIRNAASAGRAEPPARSTVTQYTDARTVLPILDPVEAWSPSHNMLARVAAHPKHHLADQALAARLLGQTRRNLLAGGAGPVPMPRPGSLLGSLFESLVVLCVRTLRPRGTHLPPAHGRRPPRG